MSRYVLSALAVVLAGCAEEPTSPSQGLAAPTAAITAAASEPVRACTVSPILSSYDVLVAWSGTATTSISLRAEGFAETVTLPHRRRAGQITVRLSFAPTSAVFFARDKVSGGAVCEFISS
jgi:hypothetical protein